MFMWYTRKGCWREESSLGLDPAEKKNDVESIQSLTITGSHLNSLVINVFVLLKTKNFILEIEREVQKQ